MSLSLLNEDGGIVFSVFDKSPMRAFGMFVIAIERYFPNDLSALSEFLLQMSFLLDGLRQSFAIEGRTYTIIPS